MFQHTAARRRLPRYILRIVVLVVCFNTQPRGGGCAGFCFAHATGTVFQHTAARRRLLLRSLVKNDIKTVSTHSRAEAAAVRKSAKALAIAEVSTHSRAEAAALQSIRWATALRFQHTAARRRLLTFAKIVFFILMFQHTAARRRLHSHHIFPLFKY